MRKRFYCTQFLLGFVNGVSAAFYLLFGL